MLTRWDIVVVLNGHLQDFSRYIVAILANQVDLVEELFDEPKISNVEDVRDSEQWLEAGLVAKVVAVEVWLSALD